MHKHPTNSEAKVKVNGENKKGFSCYALQMDCRLIQFAALCRQEESCTVSVGAVRKLGHIPGSRNHQTILEIPCSPAYNFFLFFQDTSCTTVLCKVAHRWICLLTLAGPLCISELAVGINDPMHFLLSCTRCLVSRWMHVVVLSLVTTVLLSHNVDILAMNNTKII